MKELEINNRIKIPTAELDFTFARSGGPGGQNVNKVNSKAVMFWSVESSNALPIDVKERFMQAFGMRLTREGVLVITGDRYRDQKRNMDDCLEKLAEMIRQVASPPKKRKKTKPTKASVEKRISSKKRRSEQKRTRSRGRYDD